MQTFLVHIIGDSNRLTGVDKNLFGRSCICLCKRQNLKMTEEMYWRKIFQMTVLLIMGLVKAILAWLTSNQGRTKCVILCVFMCLDL